MLSERQHPPSFTRQASNRTLIQVNSQQSRPAPDIGFQRSIVGGNAVQGAEAAGPCRTLSSHPSIYTPYVVQRPNRPGDQAEANRTDFGTHTITGRIQRRTRMEVWTTQLSQCARLLRPAQYTVPSTHLDWDDPSPHLNNHRGPKELLQRETSVSVLSQACAHHLATADKCPRYFQRRPIGIQCTARAFRDKIGGDGRDPRLCWVPSVALWRG